MTLLLRRGIIEDSSIYLRGITDAMGLHRMENPSHTEGTVTLHLYTPPFRTCQTFDEASGHKGVAKMVFDTEYGKPADSCQVNYNRGQWWNRFEQRLRHV